MKKQTYNPEKAKMNPQFTDSVVKMEVWHKEYNIDDKDNISEIPAKPGVYGLFGIIHEVPVHCRWVEASDNIQKAVKKAFENPEGEGMKNFMQSPWIQMLCYDVMEDSTEEERALKAEEWTKEYEPKIKEDGEYPQYKYVWPYDEED